MADKNLKQKINDLIFWTIMFFIFYIIIAFLLETSWLELSIALPKVNEIIKDGLTITAAFLAPASALLLFNDWKEQHNLKLVDAASRKISEDIYDLDILTEQAYYKDVLKISNYDIQLYEHPTKGSLHDIRRSIEISENIIKNSKGNYHEILFDLILFKDLSLTTENNIRSMKYATNKLKKLEQNEIVSDLHVLQLQQSIADARRNFNGNRDVMKKIQDRLQKNLKEIQI